MTALLLAFGWLLLALAMEKRRKERARTWFRMKARARTHGELQKRGELR